MNKKLMIAAFLACALGAQADGYLTATLASREQSVELASVQKITFDQAHVVIQTSEETLTLPLSEMQKISFTATPTAIANLGTESRNLGVQGGTIIVHGKGLLRVYNSEGRLVSLRRVNGSGQISASALPHGLYIIQLGQETVKFVR